MSDKVINGLYREGEPIADTKAPGGPIETKWTRAQFNNALVNPANRRKLTVIIVGTGLAGGAGAATLGEAGYNGRKSKSDVAGVADPGGAVGVW